MVLVRATAAGQDEAYWDDDVFHGSPGGCPLVSIFRDF